LHAIQKYAKLMILGVCNNGPVQKRQEDTSMYVYIHTYLQCSRHHAQSAICYAHAATVMSITSADRLARKG
jgi:hypothetical protein